MGNYSRSRNKWNNEQEALEDVCKVQNCKPDVLTAQHNEKSFMWTDQPKEKKAKEVETEKPFSLSKEEYSEKQAIELAMETLNTFEGNLQRHDTETDYGFSKVRG